MHDAGKQYYVLGIMSGSSLDGLDVAYCKININQSFTFEIICCETLKYTDNEMSWLRNIPANLNRNYNVEDIEFGNIAAERINKFICLNKIDNLDIIASHGHTIFHYPEMKKTLQIGNGKTIACLTGKTTISNFRQADIDAGGQGAPLVPIADALFFGNYNACLNIGGIANISYLQNNLRIGFDICAANQLLNYCASFINLPFDAGGSIAQTGKVDKELLFQLNDFDYYRKSFPKSMDNNWIRIHLFSLLNEATVSVEDKLATATEHIAINISEIIKSQIDFDLLNHKDYKLLITGGGAFNSFLIERIERLSNIRIYLAEEVLINFKEALAMCLMGVLRFENKPNFIPSVTGAHHAVSGGDINYYNL